MALDENPLSTLIKTLSSPLQFAAAGLVWSGLNDGAAAVISRFYGVQGKLFIANGRQSESLVWLHAALAYIVFPSVWAFFAWTNQAPQQMLRDLALDGVFTEKGERPGKERTASSGFDGRWWPFLYAAGILIVATGAYYLWVHPAAHEPGVIYNIRSHLPSTVVLWFMLWLILCRIVDAILVLDRTIRDRKPRLRPFHRDGVGGFGALERYARGLLFFFGLVFFGLMIDFVQTILIRQEQRDLILLIYVCAFVVLAPPLFWATLWPTHAAMARDRDRIHRSLMPEEWQRASFAQGTDAAAARQQAEQVEAARRLQDTIMAFPVWPFHFGPDVLLPLAESFAAASVAHLLVSALFHP